MKHKTLMALFLMPLSCWAQQALFNASEILSPEIYPDNSVKFRLFAPYADKVEISGDFISGPTPMTKDETGLWIYTSEPLSPELYMYNFNVDGVKTLDPNNVYMVRDVATVSNIFIIDEKNSRAHNYRVNDVPHGNVSRVWYNSPGLDMNRRMTIYTPPGYDDSSDSYPVLYLLHGAGGDEEAWITLGRTAQIIDNLIAERKVEPMIIVMTNGNASQSAAPGESAEGFVVPNFDVSRMNKGEFESAFPDVINYVEKHYKVKKDAQHRAIAGLSMGGFHSLHIAKQFPDLFDYIGLFSAKIFPPEGTDAPIYANFNGKLDTLFGENPKLFWIGIGDTDFLYEENKSFRKILDDNGYPYIYYETPEGHIWKNWRIYLSEFAPLLFK